MPSLSRISGSSPLATTTAVSSSREKVSVDSVTTVREGVNEVGANHTMLLKHPMGDQTNKDIVPNNEDILIGRGCGHHPGNKRLREYLRKYRGRYQHLREKGDKTNLSRAIVAAVRRADPPVRFLRRNDETNALEEVDDDRAREKVCQILREKNHSNINGGHSAPTNGRTEMQARANGRTAMLKAAIAKKMEEEAAIRAAPLAQDPPEAIEIDRPLTEPEKTPVASEEKGFDFDAFLSEFLKDFKFDGEARDMSVPAPADQQIAINPIPIGRIRVEGTGGERPPVQQFFATGVDNGAVPSDNSADGSFCLKEGDSVKGFFQRNAPETATKGTEADQDLLLPRDTNENPEEAFDLEPVRVKLFNSDLLLYERSEKNVDPLANESVVKQKLSSLVAEEVRLEDKLHCTLQEGEHGEGLAVEIKGESKKELDRSQHQQHEYRHHQHPQGSRAKLYKLNDDGTWCDWGTGRIEICYAGHPRQLSVDDSKSCGTIPILPELGKPMLCMHAETPQEKREDTHDVERNPCSRVVLLRTRVLVEKSAYQRQGNIISWCEPTCQQSSHASTGAASQVSDGVELAISFQHGVDCDKFWQRISKLQAYAKELGAKVRIIEHIRDLNAKIASTEASLRKMENAKSYWGIKEASSLGKIDDDECELNTKKAERETLRKDAANMEELTRSNRMRAGKIRQEVRVLSEKAEAAHAYQASRREKINNAVEAASIICREVNSTKDKLRESTKELTDVKEKISIEFYLELAVNESAISSKETVIESTRNQLALVEKQIVHFKEQVATVHGKIDRAKEAAEWYASYRHSKRLLAQSKKEVRDFEAITDEEPRLQRDQLDKDKQTIIDKAKHECDMIMEVEHDCLHAVPSSFVVAEPKCFAPTGELLLEKVKLDFNSGVTLEEQEDAAKKILRQHCRDPIELAKADRERRLEQDRKSRDKADPGLMGSKKDHCRQEREGNCADKIYEGKLAAEKVRNKENKCRERTKGETNHVEDATRVEKRSDRRGHAEKGCRERKSAEVEARRTDKQREDDQAAEKVQRAERLTKGKRQRERHKDAKDRTTKRNSHASRNRSSQKPDLDGAKLNDDTEDSILGIEIIVDARKKKIMDAQVDQARKCGLSRPCSKLKDKSDGGHKRRARERGDDAVKQKTKRAKNNDDTSVPKGGGTKVARDKGGGDADVRQDSQERRTREIEPAESKKLRRRRSEDVVCAHSASERKGERSKSAGTVDLRRGISSRRSRNVVKGGESARAELDSFSSATGNNGQDQWKDGIHTHSASGHRSKRSKLAGAAASRKLKIVVKSDESARADPDSFSSIDNESNLVLPSSKTEMLGTSSWRNSKGRSEHESTRTKSARTIASPKSKNVISDVSTHTGSISSVVHDKENIFVSSSSNHSSSLASTQTSVTSNCPTAKGRRRKRPVHNRDTNKRKALIPVKSFEDDACFWTK